MNKYSAFTLVELAIVIVIIGLLVGGVLQGQELIAQAKIRAQIKQLEEFNAAALTFKAKFNFLPGDVPSQAAVDMGFTGGFHSTQLLPPGSAKGGNGRLDDDLDRIPNAVASLEPILFFVQLSEKKLIKDYIRRYGTNDYAVGRAFPQAKINDGGIAAINHTDGIYYFIGTSVRSSGTGENYFVQSSPTPNLTPNQSMQLDVKLDNGIPASGSVKTVKMGWNADSFQPDTVTNDCIGTTNQVYNISSDARACYLILKSQL